MTPNTTTGQGRPIIKPLPQKEVHRPEFKIRQHGLTITAWKNQSQNGEFMTYTIDRSYKDPQGQWQTTTTLRQSDLLVLAHMLNKAYDETANQPTTNDQPITEETF